MLPFLYTNYFFGISSERVNCKEGRDRTHTIDLQNCFNRDPSLKIGQDFMVVFLFLDRVGHIPNLEPTQIVKFELMLNS